MMTERHGLKLGANPKAGIDAPAAVGCCGFDSRTLLPFVHSLHTPNDEGQFSAERR